MLLKKTNYPFVCVDLLTLNLSHFFQVKTIQGQIITVVNAVGCIAGSFFFGYKAVYYSLPEPDINMVNLNFVIALNMF